MKNFKKMFLFLVLGVLLYVPSVMAGGCTEDCVAEYNNVKYATIKEAVDAVPVGNEKVATIKVLDNSDNQPGIILFEKDKKNIEIDLGGKTITITEPAVGSKGYETQALHFERFNTVTIKNGIIKMGNHSKLKMGLQNYTVLTLQDVTLDGRNTVSVFDYTLSNNCGTIKLLGNTNIYAKEGGVAFDLYWWYNKMSGGQYVYSVGPQMIIDTTGEIVGKIELTSATVETNRDEANHSTLVIKNIKHKGTLDVQDKAAVISITGGTFISDVKNYVADGYVQTEGETYKVAKQEVKPVTPTIDTTKEVVEVKEVTVGVKEDETITENFDESLKADETLAEKIKDINVIVEVSVENQKEEIVKEEAVETITKLAKETKIEENLELKVASFFDITLNVKNKADGSKVGELTELKKELTFNVALPEDLTKVEEGFTRTYYIIRYHDGKAEILDTKLNGNVLTFETDKFSTYAIAYTDTLTTTTPAAEATPVTNPSTGDNIIAYATAGIISVMGIVGVAVHAYRKKHN